MRTEIAEIAELLQTRFKGSREFEAFAFGSAVFGDRIPNDIDILIIYRNADTPQQIRDVIDNWGDTPTHLLFLTEEEEKETQFLARQSCIAILPISVSA